MFYAPSLPLIHSLGVFSTPSEQPSQQPLFCQPLNSLCAVHAEKSPLCTDTSVDRNFHRDLGAIGPYEFQMKLDQ